MARMVTLFCEAVEVLMVVDLVGVGAVRRYPTRGRNQMQPDGRLGTNRTEF